MNYLAEGLYRLEYNEKQRLFHYDKGNHVENSFGWVNLGIMTNDDCNRFCNFMDDKYKDGLPKLSIIELELRFFLSKN